MIDRMPGLPSAHVPRWVELVARTAVVFVFAASACGTAAAHASYRAAVLADHPLAYYRLDERGGSIAHDSSGHRFDGRIGSRVVRGRPGLIADAETSMEFDGANRSSAADAIRIHGDPRFARGTSVTIEAWVLPYDVGIHGENSGDVTIAAYGRDDHPDEQHCRFALELDAHSHVFHFPAVIDGKRNGEAVTGVRSFFRALHDELWVTTSARELYAKDGTDGFPPLANHVYHLVGTYDGATMRFYIDGKLNNTMPVSGRITGYTPQDGMGIGGEYVDVNPVFHGRIGEVAIYDHVLSSDRIAAHYAAGRGGLAHRPRPHRATRVSEPARAH